LDKFINLNFYMGLFKREQPRPSEAMPAIDDAMKAMEKTTTEGYKTTPEADEARKHLEQWPDKAPHRKAIETMAYQAIPEFVHQHPGVDIEPKNLVANAEFNEVRTKISESFGVEGATVPISQKDVEAAIDLAKEYLENQTEGVETGGQDVAAA
jgi:hypothetical protein